MPVERDSGMKREGVCNINTSCTTRLSDPSPGPRHRMMMNDESRGSRSPITPIESLSSCTKRSHVDQLHGVHCI